MANGLLGLSRNQLFAAAGGLLGQGFSPSPRSGFEGFGAALKGAQGAGEREDALAQRAKLQGDRLAQAQLLQENRLRQQSELAALSRNQNAAQFAQRAEVARLRHEGGFELRQAQLDEIKSKTAERDAEVKELETTGGVKLNSNQIKRLGGIDSSMDALDALDAHLANAPTFQSAAWRKQLLSLKSQALTDLKTAAELGALTGPDLPLMEKQIGDVDRGTGFPDPRPVLQRLRERLGQARTRLFDKPSQARRELPGAGAGRAPNLAEPKLSDFGFQVQ